MAYKVKTYEQLEDDLCYIFFVSAFCLICAILLPGIIFAVYTVGTEPTA